MSKRTCFHREYQECGRTWRKIHQCVRPEHDHGFCICLCNEKSPYQMQHTLLNSGKVSD